MIRESKEQGIREAKQDPWTFVWLNFYGLAMYYANIYMRCIKKVEMFEDIRNEILYGMVDAYKAHQDKPTKELIKIIKSVPFHYYDSKLIRKDNLPKENVADLSNILTADKDRIESFYDYYYDKFMSEHYKLDRSGWTDEKEILMEIVFPTKDFQEYMEEEGSGISRVALYGYFQQKYKWSKQYFDKVFKNVSIAAVA